MRFLAAVVTLFLSFSSFGGVKTARAGAIKDIPPEINLVVNANAQFAPLKYYPALFGSTERRSTNLKPFTKWSGMFESFDTAMRDAGNQDAMAAWREDLEPYRDLPLKTMAQKVNELVNKQRYIVDSKNWGKTDYWANPVEFFERGGDCEDFAIAKYTSLRALGVPEERLRLAIVHDNEKNIPHAVLIVYTDEGAVVLDNQNKKVQPSSKVSRYRPIFSINRQAWWLHTQPKPTVLASAE